MSVTLFETEDDAGIMKRKGCRLQLRERQGGSHPLGATENKAVMLQHVGALF
jgi:hypothetical protein